MISYTKDKDNPPSPIDGFRVQTCLYCSPRALIRKQKMSVYSSMLLEVGLPAPWPAFVSRRIISGFVCNITVPSTLLQIRSVGTRNNIAALFVHVRFFNNRFKIKINNNAEV
jgi:hypothetical protein